MGRATEPGLNQDGLIVCECPPRGSAHVIADSSVTPHVTGVASLHRLRSQPVQGAGSAGCSELAVGLCPRRRPVGRLAPIAGAGGSRMPGVSDAVELAKVEAAGIVRQVYGRGTEFWFGWPLCV